MLEMVLKIMEEDSRVDGYLFGGVQAYWSDGRLIDRELAIILMNACVKSIEAGVNAAKQLVVEKE